MLGRALVEHCRQAGDTVAGFDRQALDITDADQVARRFADERPDAVINCAAWTDVDGCESDVERAFAANSFAVETLARLAREHKACFVTVSTDYVFDGSKEGFYTQRDDPSPVSVYGLAKLDGERRAAAASARTIIVRTGWLYGDEGKNFLSVIAAQARARHAHTLQARTPGDEAHRDATSGRNGGAEPSRNTAAPLRAISDAYGMPTAADDLAARLRLLAVRDLPGTYHVVAGGEGASYADFARQAFACAGDEDFPVETTSVASLARPAPRPRNSRMRCLLSEAMGLAPLPLWQESLRRYVVRPEKLTTNEQSGVTI